MSLKQKFMDTIKATAEKCGVKLLKTHQYDELISQRDSLLGQCVEGSMAQNRQGTAGIIFSMDRPVQLYATLESYFKYIKNPAPLYVLYASSSDKFKQGYQELISEFSDKSIHFVEETKFRQDLINTLNSLKEDNVFFLVDDIVFTREFDMAEFHKFDPLSEILTLRLAPYYTRCYTANVAAVPPQTLKPSKKHAGLLEWHWDDDGATCEWAYPLSVDMHLFDRREITFMTKSLSFKAPNTYEGALMQYYSAFKGRKGLCYENQYVFNNPCNKVQSENDNLAGNITPEFLMDKWNGGYKINLETFHEIKTKGPHEERSLEFIKR